MLALLSYNHNVPIVNHSRRLALLAPLLLPLAVFAGEETNPVSIVLRPEARVLSDIVRVGDLCDIRGGGGFFLRQRISELDVAKVHGDQPFEVSRSRLQIRLALADIRADAFSLTGSEQVLIVPDRVQIDEAEIVTAIKTKLAEHFVVDEQDVDVRLLQATGKIALAGARREEVRLAAVFPLNASLGTIRTKVLVYVRDQVRESVEVRVDAAVYLDVARARAGIARGEAFTQANVVSERYPVRSPRGVVTTADVIGRVAKRPVHTGAVICEYDLDDKGPVTSPVLIKVRDPVHLVAKKGCLTVVLHAAEALDQGRKGDVIRVRNLKSKKIITGQVVSGSEVHVTF